ATADMAFVDQLVSDARHRRDRDGQLELPRQPRGVDPHDTPLHIHERASGEAGVERQVQPHELIDLPAAPRPPAAPEGAYDAPAHARPVSHRQHDVAHLSEPGSPRSASGRSVSWTRRTARSVPGSRATRLAATVRPSGAMIVMSSSERTV